MDHLQRASQTPPLRMWDIRWSVGTAIAIAFLAAGTLVLVALWYLDFPAIRRDGNLSPATLFELLKIILATVGGIGAIVALVVAYRRQRVAEAANKLAEVANALAHAADERAEATRILAVAADERARAAEDRSNLEAERSGVRLLNERFTKSAEQLGSDKAAIRLAGAYSMAGLCDDWPNNRQTCIDVLCGYTRMPFDDEQGDASAQERQVRQTILRIVAQRLRPGAAHGWSGHIFDFTGATLPAEDFSGIDVTVGTRLTFRRSTITGELISFLGAKVGGGTVDFREADVNARVSLGGMRILKGSVDFAYSSIATGIPHLDGAEISGGTLSFRSSTIAGTHINLGGFRASDVFRIAGGSVSFGSAKIAAKYDMAMTFHITGGDLGFQHATITAGSLDFRNSSIDGGSVQFDYSTLKTSCVDLEDVSFTAGRIDLSRIHSRVEKIIVSNKRPPTSDQLLLPAPDWGYEMEPPF
jgi:hypothetical protein